MSQKQIFPLSKLSEAIENVINTYCSKIVWVKAEIVRLNYYSHTGHCFPELVEKKDGKIIAEIRGNIWKVNFERINEKFKLVLNEDLGDDMTVVIQATVTYHPVYGLALNILDIDPEFTLGELARQKMETIKKLQEENIFFANKQTSLELLPKTIALISVSSSKGYLDFMNVIENNPQGYKFHIFLFPAVLQGEKAVTTIISQLERIRKHKGVFDAVAIIRGGGGEVGLSCYDNYSLAKTIATFPLPVLTGIGHSTNETVSELVSYRSFITPTKIAGFLLDQFHDFAATLKENAQSLNTQVRWINEREPSNLQELSSRFVSATAKIINSNNKDLIFSTSSLQAATKSLLKKEEADLKNISTSIYYLDPQTILRRGYSITRFQGKVLKDINLLNSGDHIQTSILNGTIDSKVEKTNKTS
ncbi:MAG: exodeoxyribonuclease VII large subunit [Gillisia sp.]